MNPMYNLHVPKELKANVGENSIHLVHVPIMISLTWICVKNAWKKWTNTSLPNGVFFMLRNCMAQLQHEKKNTLNKPIGSMGMVYLLTCPIECGHFSPWSIWEICKKPIPSGSKPRLRWTGWSQTREWRAGPAGWRKTTFQNSTNAFVLGCPLMPWWKLGSMVRINGL